MFSWSRANRETAQAPRHPQEPGFENQQQLRREGLRVQSPEGIERRSSRKNGGLQNVSRTPTCAAKGMPTVVPGPKKSPRAPDGTRSCFPLVTGRVCVQAGLRHRAVTLARLFTGVGRAL